MPCIAEHMDGLTQPSGRDGQPPGTRSVYVAKRLHHQGCVGTCVCSALGLEGQKMAKVPWEGGALGVAIPVCVTPTTVFATMECLLL